MKDKRIEKIGRTLAVFDFGRLQELLTLWKLLKREEITLEEVQEFVKLVIQMQKTREAEFKKRNLEMKRVWDMNTRRCPTCTKPLMARAIRASKGRANVKGYTCHWYCEEGDCNFEEYSHEDFKEVYQKIMGGR